MRVTRFLVALALLVIPGELAAQPGNLRGRAIRPDGAPVTGVRVNLVGTVLQTDTDGAGDYAISGIPAGSYTVRFTPLGGVAANVTVTVGPGTVTVQNFVVVNAGPVLQLLAQDAPPVQLPLDSLVLPVPDSAIIRRRQTTRVSFTPVEGLPFLLELFGNTVLTVRLEQVTRTNTGTRAYGEILSSRGTREGRVTLAVEGDRITANIQHGLQRYMIRAQARGVHLVVEIDPLKIGHDHNETPDTPREVPAVGRAAGSP